MSIQEEIKAFVDGELSPEMTETVGREIEGDPALAEQVAFYRLLSEEIREIAVEPQVIGADETLAAVRQGRRFRWRELAAPLGIAAVVLVVGGLTRGAGGGALSSTVISQPGSFTARSVAEATRGPMANKATGGGSPYAPRYELGVDVNGLKAEGSRVPMVSNAVPAQNLSAGVDESVTKRPSSQWYSNQAATGFLPSTPNKAKNDAYFFSQRSSASATPNRPPNPKTLSQADTATGRMVVQNGDIDIAVADPSRAESDTLNHVRLIGGFASSSSMDRDENQNPMAQLTLRVPVARFSETMDFLKRFAKDPKDIKSEHVTGQDVTGDYADATARLRELRAEEESYVQMLRGLRHVDDVLSVKDRISDVRQQIESLEAQAAALKDTSALSTIQVTFELKTKPADPVPANPQTKKDWSSQAWSDAFDGVKSAGQFLGTGSIFAIVYAPLWLPIAAAAWWLTRKRI